MELEDVGYHVLGPIARGGMAEVVLAERVGPGGVRKRLAIKRLFPELASDPEFLRVLEDEARIAVELDHANVVSVFELGEADGELFLATEFVRGWSLATVLEACAGQGREMPTEVALHIAYELALALAYAHGKADEHGAPLGIVHQDVSPSNVLLSVDGAVKLADFGLARAAASAKKMPGGWRRAKVPYMSPEQAIGEPLDARSDIYSLGALLFEMLTGKRLFPTDFASATLARSQPLPKLAASRPGASTLQPLLERALAISKIARFPSADAFADALATAIASIGRPSGAAALRAFLDRLGLPAPAAAPEGDPEKSVERPRDDAFASPPRSSRAEDVAPRLPAASPAAGAARPSSPRVSSLFEGMTAKVAMLAFAVALALFFLSAWTIRRALEPAGTLEVRTAVPGASVWIDGRPAGTTPLVVRDLPRRVVSVRVGFSTDRSSELEVDLRSARDQTLDLDVR